MPSALPARPRGSGTVRLASHDAAGSIGIAGGAGTLQLLQTLVDRFAGVSLLTIGRSDGSGTITANGLTLPTDLAIAGGSGNVSFTATVDSAGASARDLTVGTAGNDLVRRHRWRHARPRRAHRGRHKPHRRERVGGCANVHRRRDPHRRQHAQRRLGALRQHRRWRSRADPERHDDPLRRRRRQHHGADQLAHGFAAGTTELGGNVTTSGAQSYGDRLQLNADATLSRQQPDARRRRRWRTCARPERERRR